jgi:DNA-binding NarL/FixJ family response regulator
VELTTREREVLRLLAEGLEQEAIARELFITPKTGGTHIQHILGKLGVHNGAQAVALAYREHLVQGPVRVLGAVWPVAANARRNDDAKPGTA